MRLPLSLVALAFLGSSASAQTGDFEFCPPGLTSGSCSPETWVKAGGGVYVEPFGPISPQLGFPTKGTQWAIVSPVTTPGFLVTPPGGPAPYPLAVGTTGGMTYKNIALGSTISFDYNYVTPECPQETTYNDFFTVDLVDPSTGMPVANIHYQDTWSTNYSSSTAVTPDGLGIIPGASCAITMEVAPVGTAKSVQFQVPAPLVGGVYNLEFHVGNSGDDGWHSYFWIDNILNGSLGPVGSCTYRKGTLGVNPDGYDCVTMPSSGQPWASSISVVPTVGTTTLQTMVVVGMGGPVDSLSLYGFEVLTAGPYITDSGMGSHMIAVPAGLSGLSLATQGLRIEVDTFGAYHIVLLNAQDIVIG